MAMKFEKKADGVFHLDCQGYVCPHPQIYTKKALEKLQPGDILELLFDNASSSETISAMMDSSGHEIVERQQEGGKFRWKIKKAA
jgi:tRNA 2-thiouridine synthesizing protein A